MAENVIAIDGPAASGKSTIAGLLADRLGIPYINTGNMYRAVTYYAIQQGIGLSDCSEETLSPVLKQIKLDYVKAASGQYEIMLNGEFPGAKIRTPEIASLVSPVAALPNVRAWLIDKQREFARLGRIVMEGRDIGTVIFPGAQYKFFLTASPEERARRRLAQDGESPDGATVESVAKAIAERDLLDSTRKTAPLKKAADAILIDTGGMSIEQVIEQILRYIK
ncbi:MAG: (d)CMP kinase [Victivallaceae bacterium]|jgi:cytidylate kinase